MWSRKRNGRLDGSIAFIAGGLVSIASSIARGGTLPVVDLGTIAGTEYYFPTGISDSKFVITGNLSSPGINTPFRWSAITGMVSLGLPSSVGRPGLGNQAVAINTNGSIIAGMGPYLGGVHATRWTVGGGFQDLGTMPGGQNSGANGMNQTGSVIVGGAQTAEGGRAIRWTQSDGMQSLGVLPGTGTSDAKDVSSDGSVVMGTSDGRVFRWTQPSGMVEIAELPQAEHTLPRALSGDGSAFTGSIDLRNTNNTTVFRWTISGGMQDIGTLPGGLTAEGFDISQDGSMIVGRSETGFTNSSAFLWTTSLGMVDLNSYLPTLGYDLTGWTLRGATAISRDGKNIAGFGWFEGEERAWAVAGVPAPGTASVLACALVLCSRRRRRQSPHAKYGQS